MDVATVSLGCDFDFGLASLFRHERGCVFHACPSIMPLYACAPFTVKGRRIFVAQIFSVKGNADVRALNTEVVASVKCPSVQDGSVSHVIGENLMMMKRRLHPTKTFKGRKIVRG